jgi:hypothetical protein
MDDPMTTRRRLLEGASVGGGALLAGCTDRLDLGGGDGESGSGTDTVQAESGGTSIDGVGAIATVDQEALRQAQLEIRESLQAGNITREEAQEEFSQLREQYITEAVSALAETAAETDGVDVGQEYPSLGAVILTGEAAPIIRILDSADVSALVARSDVEDRAGTATTTSQG